MKYKYHVRIWNRKYDMRQRVHTASIKEAFAIMRERVKQGFQCDMETILDQSNLIYQRQFNDITDREIQKMSQEL